MGFGGGKVFILDSKEQSLLFERHIFLHACAMKPYYIDTMDERIIIYLAKIAFPSNSSKNRKPSVCS